MSFIPTSGQTSGGFPVVPDTIYTSPGAITLTDTFALLQPGSGFTEASPMAMTLGNGTIGKTLLIKMDGVGAATITGNFDRVSGTKLTLFSPNGRGSVWLLWNVASATWYVMDQYDPGKLRSDLQAAGALSTSDLTDVTQTGVDARTTLGALAQLVQAQSLPTVPLSGTTTLSYAAHNQRCLYCTSSLTLVVPSGATLGEGFTTSVYAIGTSTVSLSGTVVDLAGTQVISITGSTSAKLEVCSGIVYCDRHLGSSSTGIALVINGISGQTPGGTSTASLSFTGGAPATLTATLDGSGLTIASVTITTTSGSGATAAGTASFTFTTPSAGTHSVVASSTGAYATQSNAYTLTTSTSPIIAITSVTPTGAGVVNATASGSFSAGLPASITATMDGGALSISGVSITTTSGSGATAAGTWSFTFTNPAAGSHSLVVASTGTYAATSAAYSYSTANTTLTINTITAPAPITSLTVGGSYTNWTPTGLQYSINSTNGVDGAWTTASSPTIGSGAYVFTISAGFNAGTYTLWVRGLTNPQITASSNSFTITATGGTIAAPTGTQVNSASSFPITITGSGNPTVYASITSGGTEQTPRTAAFWGSTSVSLTPTAAAASTASLYRVTSGGTALATSGSFTPAAAGGGYPTLTTGGTAYAAIYDAALGVTVSSGLVTTLADQSGNAANLTGTTGVSQGATVAGVQGLQFAGTSSSSTAGLTSTSSTWMTGLALGCTLAIVFKTASSLPPFGSGGGGPVLLHFTTGASPYDDDMAVIASGTDLRFFKRVNSWGGNSDSIGVLATNTLYKLIVRFNPNNGSQSVQQWWLNGSGGTHNSTTLSSAANYTLFGLGQTPYSGTAGFYLGFSPGLIYEQLIIKGAVSDTDIATLQSYQTSRWGS
jgi:hypothetical protein